MTKKLLPDIGHLLVTLKNTLPAVLLLGALSLSLTPAAQAQITITISPVGPVATTTQFSVTATGVDAGSTDTITTGAGYLNFLPSGSVDPFNTLPGVKGAPGSPDFVSSSLSVNEFPVTSVAWGSSTQLTFLVNPHIALPVPNRSFSGSHFVGDLGSGNTYLNHFTPGSYSISSGSSFFSTSASGTMTILASASAVPEPGSFALLAGFLALGFVGTRRRRTSPTA